jgi:hypothetical protein
MMRMGSNKPKKLIHQLEQGQSLMELSVVIVLMIILLAGIIDLGKAILTHFIIQDAAEEGMIYGTSFPTDCDQITLRIRNNVEKSIVKTQVTVAIEIPNSSGDYQSCYSIPYAQVYAGKVMRITVNYDFPITMPFLGAILGEQKIPIVIVTKGTILRPPPPS